MSYSTFIVDTAASLLIKIRKSKIFFLLLPNENKRQDMNKSCLKAGGNIFS